MSGFGSARYGGGTKKNYFKIKEGDQVFRILPPYGALAREGKWATYYSVHFGYKNSEGKLKPFQSPEVKNRKTKMIEVPDAAKTRIDQLKANQEQAKLDGNMDLVKKLGEALKTFNMQNKWYMNAVDLSGNIGLLPIPHRMKMALDAEIQKLIQKGVDPLSADNGRFFVFSRSGTGSNTIHKVSVYKEAVNINGVEAEVDKVHKIGADLESRMKAEGFELSTLYPKPTSTEVERIVKEGAKAVDEIFAKPSSTESSYDGPADDEEESAPTPAPIASAPVSTPAPLASVETVVSPAKPAQTPVPAAAAPAAQVGGKAVAEMSNEEFLKSLGL